MCISLKRDIYKGYFSYFDSVLATFLKIIVNVSSFVTAIACVSSLNGIKLES